ncbi:hypothetical protein K466DRAFT_292877 [Polyporus arcularius HHB13444]|uniref:Uncharacterized protein n=2 Tax=Polyporaceae TaxID=5317 RepID=A0A5C3Q868_9APHY|nr:hypothetical protein OH76DRAFT_1033965 [Polyporus brumalis]TFK94623.1 hypothetical protein K466DRAFT_292877 [Polyporus arcularius HHB13444]
MHCHAYGQSFFCLPSVSSVSHCCLLALVRLLHTLLTVPIVSLAFFSTYISHSATHRLSEPIEQLCIPSSVTSVQRAAL